MDSTQAFGGDAIVTLESVSKSYGGVQALIDMTLEVERGSVHAVVGENGAGKSTLMKILAGAEQPDAGRISIDGTPVEVRSPFAAERLGIGIVYQELTVFPERSILANLFVDQQPTRYGWVDTRAMERTARPVIDAMGLTLPLDTPVSELGVGEQQLVELTRLLIRRPKVLILDEPNSALNDQETERLFAVLRQVVAGGTTVIYVSHRLEEVFTIADRVTVMRGGHQVWTKGIDETSIPDVVTAMVGMGVGDLFPPRPARPAATEARAALEVRDLCVGDEVRDVTFSVRAGEVVGLAGLDGAGTATLLGAIFGTRWITRGSVTFPDGAGSAASPTEAARRHISLVPADRKVQGLMLERSIEWNISQVAVGAVGSRLWLGRNSMAEAADRQIAGMRIKAPDRHAIVGGLSGGNQQKVVVGKWLETEPTVFLLDDPTRGVDVGAKAEIYRLIRRLSDAGAVILFRSSELPELVGLADRILVMYRGRLAGQIDGTEATEARLLTAVNTGSVAVSA